jgi:hypothetical protein
MESIVDWGKIRSEAIKEFEKTKEHSELMALAKISLERPLTDKEYNRMMELKEKIDELI